MVDVKDPTTVSSDVMNDDIKNETAKKEDETIEVKSSKKKTKRRDPRKVHENYQKYCERWKTWDIIKSQWDDTVPGNPDPATLLRSDDIPVHWKCEHGHKWVESPLQRGRRARCLMCPPPPGIKALSKEKPFLRDMYSPNNKIPFDALPVGGTSPVLWVCPNGHEFPKSPARMSRNQACPLCARKEVSPEESVFATHPQLREHWDWELNEGIDPNKLTAESHVMVYWKCPNGHRSRATVAAKASVKSKQLCAYCTKKRCPKELSIGVLYPELASEIISSGYNTGEEDDNIYKKSPASKDVVRWKCRKCGGEFDCMIRGRVEVPRCRICEKGTRPNRKARNKTKMKKAKDSATTYKVAKGGSVGDDVQEPQDK